MLEDPYKPIACGDYDIYEIAIMKQRKLTLEWTDADGGTVNETVTPLELKIIEGAEYLFYEIENKKTKKTTDKLRLDKINSATIC